MITSTPTWMGSLLSRLNVGAMLAILLIVIAAATASFMATFISLLQTGSMATLAGAFLAAAMLLSAIRAMCSGYNDLTAPTTTFLLLMSGIALLGAYACRIHSMRMTLIGLGALLLLVAAFYFIRCLQLRRRDPVVTTSQQPNP